MATKTEEKLQAIDKSVALLEDRLDQLRERARENDRAQTDLNTRLTRVETQFSELKSAVEDDRKNRRTLWLALLGIFLTFVANVIITTALKK